MAREALANDQNETVIETLEPAISELQDEPELGEALFLLGKAHFQRAEKAVSGKSSQQRMFQAMPKEVISDLLSAYEYFMEAAWLVNEEGILIQIYYFAGRTQDAGYLQDFQKASEHYKSAFSISATDTYGQKALERYSVIAKWLDMYKSE